MHAGNKKNISACTECPYTQFGRNTSEYPRERSKRKTKNKKGKLCFGQKNRLCVPQLPQNNFYEHSDARRGRSLAKKNNKQRLAGRCWRRGRVACLWWVFLTHKNRANVVMPAEATGAATTKKIFHAYAWTLNLGCTNTFACLCILKEQRR